jgi:hypothetical protein
MLIHPIHIAGVNLHSNTATHARSHALGVYLGIENAEEEYESEIHDA